MKNIAYYPAQRYAGTAYTEIEPMIYRTEYTVAPDGRSLALCEVEKERVPELSALTGWQTDDFDEDMESLVYNGTKYYREKPDSGDEVCYFKPDPAVYGKHIAYVTSIVFEQEPEYDENEPDDAEISEYPLEDILEEFDCMAGDAYIEENENDPVHAYLEFAADEIGSIRRLLKSILGKHVYNKDEDESVILVIE